MDPQTNFQHGFAVLGHLGNEGKFLQFRKMFYFKGSFFIIPCINQITFLTFCAFSASALVTTYFNKNVIFPNFSCSTLLNELSRTN